jgi:molecular chaperone DnaK (HSP70)
MNWKRYRELTPKEKQNEAYYVIGLDIGNDSSAVAFYNLAENTAEAIDMSGGYGKSSIPTVMQYAPESKEWVFGEYALLNCGVGTIFTSFLARMGRFDYLDVDGRSISVASVFSLFVKEILTGVKSINPKAEIVGIVASIPAYFSTQAQEEFTRVFKLAGYEKELIGFVPDRECILVHHYRVPPETPETALILDLGNRELRGGVYDVSAAKKGSINAVSLSSVFDNEISMAALNHDVYELLKGFLKDSVVDKEQLLTFTHQHKDILFQKNIRMKPAKLYYNFVYPPVQHMITNEIVSQLIEPYVKRFNQFIRDVLDKNLSERRVTPSQVDAILCAGGGFDMLWAREAVSMVFSGKVRFHKNPKLINAEGAALIAARKLGILDSVPLFLEDNHQLTNDIGLYDGVNFLTLVERNSFWWQKHSSKLILVKSAVSGELDLQLAELLQNGEGRDILQIKLDGLPERPKGVTRLEVGLDFKSNTEMIFKVRDMGFGNLFPKVVYEREFNVKLSWA